MSSGKKEQTVQVINTEGHLSSKVNVTALIRMMLKESHDRSTESEQKEEFKECTVFSVKPLKMYHIMPVSTSRGLYRLRGSTGWGRGSVCVSGSAMLGACWENYELSSYVTRTPAQSKHDREAGTHENTRETV